MSSLMRQIEEMEKSWNEARSMKQITLVRSPFFRPGVPRKIWLLTFTVIIKMDLNQNYQNGPKNGPCQFYAIVGESWGFSSDVGLHARHHKAVHRWSWYLLEDLTSNAFIGVVNNHGQEWRDKTGHHQATSNTLRHRVQIIQFNFIFLGQWTLS